MGGACGARGGEERHIQGFGGEPERKRPLGRPRPRWKDNIKRIFRKWEGVVGTGWSGLRIGIFRKWEGIVGTGWSGLSIGKGGGHL
jgi:hypothetical protein